MRDRETMPASFGWDSALQQQEESAAPTTTFATAGALPAVAQDAACRPTASARAYGCEGLGKAGDKVSIKAAWEWAKAHPYQAGFAISLGVLGVFTFGSLALLGLGMIDAIASMGIMGTIIFYGGGAAAAAVGGVVGATGGKLNGELVEEMLAPAPAQ